MEDTLRHQYALARGSRDVLLDYCATFTPEDLSRELPGFGRGSVRNLLVHIANTYEFWLGEFAMLKAARYAVPEEHAAVESIHSLFGERNRLVEEFLAYFPGKWTIDLTSPLRGREVTATPLTLFTHVITHEFHHKGQILSMGRQLGYLPPPDTDVMR